MEQSAGSREGCVKPAQPPPALQEGQPSATPKAGQQETGHSGEILTSLGFSVTKLILKALHVSFPDQYSNILPTILSSNASGAGSGNLG